MPVTRFGRMQRAAAVIPLALLSAAWTASLAGAGPANVSAAGDPDGDANVSVPTAAIEAPASLSSSDPMGSTGADYDTQQIVSNSSTNGIPAAALSAYQRAETVINSADKSCNLTWQLVAAIGRVESNHGRFGGNALDSQGVARPGIYGVVLDGKTTATIRDTDGGQYDKLTGKQGQYDRAVGPMQFIPGTWSVVGVDADDDGQRNPQDIDDAALAAAVYLCSGDDDLSTIAGQRAAIFRYNHSQAYVDLVINVMNQYLEGDFTSVPNSTLAAGFITPQAPAPTTKPSRPKQSDGELAQTDNGTDAPSSPTTPDSEPDPEPKPDPKPSNNNGGLTGNNGPLNPDNDNVPNTGNKGVDDILEDVVDGLLGPIKALENEIQFRATVRKACFDAFPTLLEIVDRASCRHSYGVFP